MDDVFRALADPSRRELLDRLFRTNGQTLQQLSEGLEMTRFGVMKHLGVLESAGLVTTRRVGREKHHYLNPVPIRLVHDRWVSKYTAPFAAALAQLKHRLEGGPEPAPAAQIHEVVIRATPQAVWRALTDPVVSAHVPLPFRLPQVPKPGEPLRRVDGAAGVAGRIVEARPAKLLSHTWTGEPGGEGRAEPGRVTWRLERRRGLTKLTVDHDLTGIPTAQAASLADRWTLILSGIKTLLETGKPLAPAEA